MENIPIVYARAKRPIHGFLEGEVIPLFLVSPLKMALAEDCLAKNVRVVPLENIDFIE